MKKTTYKGEIYVINTGMMKMCLVEGVHQKFRFAWNRSGQKKKSSVETEVFH